MLIYLHEHTQKVCVYMYTKCVFTCTYTKKKIIEAKYEIIRS